MSSINNNNNNNTNASMRQALIHLHDFNIKRFLIEIFKVYKHYLQLYPVYTKSITSCTIAMIGEIIRYHY